LVVAAVSNELGLIFKGNDGDLRNSKMIGIVSELQSGGVEVFVTGPQAEAPDAIHEYGVQLIALEDMPSAHVIVAASAHPENAEMSAEHVGRNLVNGATFIEVKAALLLNGLRSTGPKVLAAWS
jgi:UDP-N-acetyl-D-glucosamine/UDP-N-acetyl-D-galactosamine dehydrogenase